MLNLDTYNIIAVSLVNEHQHVNNEYKATQRIMWHSLLSQTTSCLNNHVIVRIQSNVIIWVCGKNKRALFISGLIAIHWKYWWTMPMYVEPFLLFITKRSKFNELELTQKRLKWIIEWVTCGMIYRNVLEIPPYSTIATNVDV